MLTETIAWRAENMIDQVTLTACLGRGGDDDGGREGERSECGDTMRAEGWDKAGREGGLRWKRIEEVERENTNDHVMLQLGWRMEEGGRRC